MSPTSISGGRIEVITGCMFSGKTDELIRRLERSKIAGEEVEVFKPVIDDRYGDDVIGSHNGKEWKAKVVDTEEESIDPILDIAEDADVVGFDEANFFSEELIQICEKLASKGCRVIVCGLDQTYRGEPFRPVPGLTARADYVKKLQAICNKCGQPATKTQRLIDGEPAHVDEPTVVVGADERYEARCRNCHELKK
jgi:thymidine kinase